MTPGRLIAFKRLLVFAGRASAETDTMLGVPTKGTRARSVRVGDDVWLPFVQMCERKGENPSRVLRESIRGYMAIYEDDVWTRALEVAAERGENLDVVVRNLLEEYIGSGTGLAGDD